MSSSSSNPVAISRSRRTTAVVVRYRSIILAGIALTVVVGSLAAGIVLTQQGSRSRLLANLGLRGTTSASFVSTYLSQQASREQAAARQFMSGARVSSERFRIVVAAFGSNAAVLLDSAGRVLDVVPSDPALIGKAIGARYSHLTAEHGSVAVSNVVPWAVKHAAVAAIAVPFSAPQGRRVFSAAYGVAGSTLGAFVAHTISYPQHEVYLVRLQRALARREPKNQCDDHQSS